MIKILGIGDAIITADPMDLVKTYSLGSCVAIVLYCPMKKVLAMAHCALPDSKIDPEKSKSHPCYFVDTAIQWLMEGMKVKYHCNLDRLQCKVVGGSEPCWKGYDTFNIGLRNIQAVKEGLNRNRVYCSDYDDTGGVNSRTVTVKVIDGVARVKTTPIRTD